MGIPVFVLEQWPYETIQEYRTQNIITPFTQSSINAREGVAIEVALNQNRTKKDRHVKASDVLSYLKGELSEVFEHQDIKKVKSIMQNLAMFDIDPKTHDIYPAICGSLKEEMEKGEAERDMYLIKRLHEFKKLIDDSSENYNKGKDSE
ncbi:TPA: hypothetical protein RQN07_002741 [Aeromonas dhakensis]|uniref:hypothetical protein n=1 Tax=Aeromonas dhakensis TaxID=196024 RepID=UPI0028914B84|nr:hypothetical protein [Aeromonas dhakensis]HDX8469009.1 hypothetical protein [Aeromonas dhakensis]HDZ8869524.1 hypothetical protein [Aeromonas dhakensis]HDZ8931144.1 hypothetical protein [Aeromonas dhakensis]HEA3208350.1 hypothetical protein [Aeromonas dhakensis]